MKCRNDPPNSQLHRYHRARGTNSLILTVKVCVFQSEQVQHLIDYLNRASFTEQAHIFALGCALRNLAKHTRHRCAIMSKRMLLVAGTGTIISLINFFGFMISWYLSLGSAERACIPIWSVAASVVAIFIALASVSSLGFVNVIFARLNKALRMKSMEFSLLAMSSENKEESEKLNLMAATMQQMASIDTNCAEASLLRERLFIARTRKLTKAHLLPPAALWHFHYPADARCGLD